MTARIGNYVGLVPATASLEFPFVGHSILYDMMKFHLLEIQPVHLTNFCWSRIVSVHMVKFCQSEI